MLKFWYFTWEFLVTWLFCGYHCLDLLTMILELYLIIENLNIANNFSTTKVAELSYFTLIYFLWYDLLVLNILTFFENKETLFVTGYEILGVSNWSEHFLSQDLCSSMKLCVPVPLAIFGIGHYRNHLCFSSTSRSKHILLGQCI